MFNLFSPPCFAAMGAMNAELKSKKWFIGGVALQLADGYTVAYLVYTVGTLIFSPSALNITAAFAGLAAVTAFALIITVLIIKGGKNTKKEYELS